MSVPGQEGMSAPHKHAETGSFHAMTSIRFTVTVSGLGQQGGERGHPVTEGQGRMQPLSLPFAFQWPGRGPAASAAREAGKCHPASWPRAQEEEDSLRGRPEGLQHLPFL